MAVDNRQYRALAEALPETISTWKDRARARIAIASIEEMIAEAEWQDSLKRLDDRRAQQAQRDKDAGIRKILSTSVKTGHVIRRKKDGEEQRLRVVSKSIHSDGWIRKVDFKCRDLSTRRIVNFARDEFQVVTVER